MIIIRLARALKITAVIYLAYLALMTLVAMPALNILAPRIYHQQTGRELRLDKIILLNPFTLTLSVRNASSADADGSHFWSFDLLRINASVTSLWRRHLVLDELQLRGLDLQIDQKNAQRYNFSDILDYRRQHFPAQAEVQKPPATADKPFALDIERLIFSAKHIGLRAPYWSEPLALDINDINIALADLTTAADKNTAAAKSTALRTGAIDFAMKTIGIQFLREQEPFATRLQNLHIAATELASDAAREQPLTFSIADAGGGQLALKAAVALGDSHGSGALTLRNLDLLPALHYLSPKLGFTALRAALDGDIQFALNWREPLHYALHDSRVNLHDIQLQSKSDKDTAIALASLQLDGIAVDSAQARAQIAKIALREPVLSGWNRDAKVSLLDMAHVAAAENKKSEAPWQIRIDDIESAGGAVHWRASQLGDLALLAAPLNVHVSNVHWPDAAPLQLRFDTRINNDTKFALQGELVPADMTGKFSAEVGGLPLVWANPILSRRMRATLHSGQLSARAQLTVANGAPVRLLSEGVVDQLELQQLADKHKLLAWKQLQWRQLALDLPKSRLRIRQIAVDQPWAQFLINADGTNNFQQLLIEQKTASQRPDDKPLRFAIDTIQIDRATLDFRDNSLPRSFRTNIGDFSGTITGLSNRANGSAKVALKGAIDGYAPVALSGTTNPFATPRSMNIALDITNLDLAALTPYSGTYAGYQIDKGRLTVQLDYTLEDNRIKGTNHIVVNQMQLGKQVSGPKVMDLPLRFAIYLLTDENGVMDLGVDVAGNVDDPNFSVSSIIWKAFRNLIVKTVTSPFKALAHLVGGQNQEDLNRVEFSPGSDQTSAEDHAKLRTLAAALEKKPALTLSVTGHVSPSQDIEALRDVDLGQALIAQGDVTAADIQQQTKNWQRAVAKLFGTRFPERKSETLAPMQMNDAIRDNIELSSDALQKLADRRAIAVKQLLVTDMGLPADRAVIKAVDLGADKDPGLTATMAVN